MTSSQKNINTFATILFLFFVLQLVACPLWGQALQKKTLNSDDYHLWGELNIDKISSDQKYISFKMSYENGIDSLFVRDIKDSLTFRFANIDQADFAPDHFLICKNSKGLQIINLKTKQQEIIPDVNKYSYSNVSNQLVILKSAEENEFIVRSASGRIIHRIQDVTDFTMSPDKKKIVCSVISSNTQKLLLLNLADPKFEKIIFEHNAGSLKDLLWQQDGKSFVFFTSKSSSAEKEILYYYLTDTNILYKLSAEDIATMGINASVALSTFSVVRSDDLQKVFFNVRCDVSTALENNNSICEIWNANDKWIYAQNQKQGSLKNLLKTVLWQPALKQLTAISTDQLPKLMLSSDCKYAVLSNHKEYEPQFESNSPRDFYILDLKTMKKELFLTRQTANSDYINVSPMGGFIAYYKEKNWWTYNIKTKKHINITAAVPTKFCGKLLTLEPESVYGSPGWSNNDNEILLYDQFDIWAIKPDGSSTRRLTKGRELQIQFRVITNPENYNPKRFDGQIPYSFDLSKHLYLRAEGEDGRTGYFIWKKNTEKPVIYQNSYIDQMSYSRDQKTIVFREQRYDLSPRIVTLKPNVNSKVLYQSNPHQKQFYWGYSKLIDFKNSHEQKLKGVLIYPGDYNPSKKYPMIVRIYERQAKNIHKYINPSLYNDIGFNPSLYTTRGYFVFLPDIKLEKRNPGISAADCVTSGVKKVIDLKLVEPDKIGLIGHSFGGYESAFIITQTPIFATAVSSGGITDLTSYYLTVNQNSGKPDMWRFQNEQWNMGSTIFEAPEDYDRNSPIVQVQKIKTPLLLWSGKQDEQVDSRQSIELYLAMRRLGKKNIMLLYPGEGHSILKPENQKDLSCKLMQWFDYFLKEEKSISWITQGTLETTIN